MIKLDKQKKLILCHTPFHVLLALLIIKEFPNNNYYCVYYLNKTDDNTKHKLYREKLKEVSYKFYYLELKNTKMFNSITSLLQVKKFIRNNFSNIRFDQIIFAPITSNIIFVFLNKIKFNDIFTFDDGIANINILGEYFSKKTSKKALINRILVGCRYFKTAFLINKIKLHYTIFENNVFTKNVYMLNNTYGSEFKNVICPEFKTVSIFLGQPINEVFPNFDNNILHEIIKGYNIDFYLPHPREKNMNLDIKTIETNLIAEDYIYELLQSGYKIKLYSFFSTALLTTPKSLNLEKNAFILNSFPYGKLSYVYDLFKSNKINIITI